MKVLVTGGSGLLGANIARAAVTAGHDVRALVRSSSRLSSLEGLPIEIARGDILDSEAVQGAVTGCAWVFHCAVPFAYGPQTTEPLDAVAEGGTRNVLLAGKRAGVERVVLTSSSVVFGYSNVPQAADESHEVAKQTNQPSYVAAKIRQHLLAQEWADELGIDLVRVCPTMSVGAHGVTLGPSNGVIVGYLVDPWRATYPGGCNIVAASDVAKGHLLAAEHGSPGSSYLLGSENLTWLQVHTMIAELSGIPTPRIQLNHSMSYLAASAQELLASRRGERPIVTRDQASMVGRYYWYDHSLASALGYRPRPARAALAEAVAWLVASPHVSREVRTTIRLHTDVYAARRELNARERLRLADFRVEHS